MKKIKLFGVYFSRGRLELFKDFVADLRYGSLEQLHFNVDKIDVKNVFTALRNGLNFSAKECSCLRVPVPYSLRGALDDILRDVVVYGYLEHEHNDDALVVFYSVLDSLLTIIDMHLGLFE